MSRSMIHLNGHILCAIDVETTGLKPRYHDVIQVCCLLLDSEIRPLKGILPFYMEMQPRRPENIDLKAMTVNKMALYDIMARAMDADRVADLFGEWYGKLPLPFGKKLVPLAHNWPHDRAFIEDWLGYEGLNDYFFGHYRDTQCCALFENDKADAAIEQTPYPKLGLSNLAARLGVEHERAHDSLADCITTAEVFRRMVRVGIFNPLVVGQDLHLLSSAHDLLFRLKHGEQLPPAEIDEWLAKSKADLLDTIT